MKIDRLIGILAALQQQGSVTAPYLAAKFEVSTRTIYRDVEAICRAGIPLVTVQGKGGGISIMDGFAMDTTLFTREEIEALFTGLQALDSVSKVSGRSLLSEKLGSENHTYPTGEVLIDLSSFHKDSLTNKIGQLRSAIRTNKTVSFRYYYEKGESEKIVEPYLVVFRWAAWYLFGFCTEKQDFRLYKLTRLWNLRIDEADFIPRSLPPEKLQFGQHMTDDKLITALYTPDCAYRLVEEYGPGCYTVSEEGLLDTRWGFTSYKDALQWFLGFGGRVTITGPDDFLAVYLAEIEKINNKYKDT